jgi:hypothetical protein
MYTQINPDLKSILFNILGGIIVAFLAWLYPKVYRILEAIKFRKIFGNDSVSEIRLIYGKMFLMPCYDERGQRRTFPYHKPGLEGTSYKVSSVLPDTEASSIKYLSDSFSKNVNESPLMICDEDVKDKIDLSYVSFGGLNNWKSISVINSEENTFYKFLGSSIVSVKDKNEEYKITSSTDYALIIKIKPKQFPKRIHICVAGIGELGTRGASYFLGRKWKEILKITKGKEFGIIIKVTDNSDETAQIVKVITKK